ncbi:MAG: hypothetical protein ACOY3D_06155, partial [Candidatus Omnitrophota bacterium]
MIEFDSKIYLYLPEIQSVGEFSDNLKRMCKGVISPRRLWERIPSDIFPNVEMVPGHCFGWRLNVLLAIENVCRQFGIDFIFLDTFENHAFAEVRFRKGIYSESPEISAALRRSYARPNSTYARGRLPSQVVKSFARVARRNVAKKYRFWIKRVSPASSPLVLSGVLSLPKDEVEGLGTSSAAAAESRRTSAPAAFSSLARELLSSSAVRSRAYGLSSLAAKGASSPAGSKKVSGTSQEIPLMQYSTGPTAMSNAYDGVSDGIAQPQTTLTQPPLLRLKLSGQSSQFSLEDLSGGQTITPTVIESNIAKIKAAFQGAVAFINASETNRAIISAWNKFIAALDINARRLSVQKAISFIKNKLTQSNGSVNSYLCSAVFSPASAKGRVETMARPSAEASTSEGRRAASPAGKDRIIRRIGEFFGKDFITGQDYFEMGGLNSENHFKPPTNQKLFSLIDGLQLRNLKVDIMPTEWRAARIYQTTRGKCAEPDLEFLIFHILYELETNLIKIREYRWQSYFDTNGFYFLGFKKIIESDRKGISLVAIDEGAGFSNIELIFDRDKGYVWEGSHIALRTIKNVLVDGGFGDMEIISLGKRVVYSARSRGPVVTRVNDNGLTVVGFRVFDKKIFSASSPASAEGRVEVMARPLREASSPAGAETFNDALFRVLFYHLADISFDPYSDDREPPLLCKLQSILSRRRPSFEANGGMFWFNGRSYNMVDFGERPLGISSGDDTKRYFRVSYIGPLVFVTVDKDLNGDLLGELWQVLAKEFPGEYLSNLSNVIFTEQASYWPSNELSTYSKHLIVAMLRYQKHIQGRIIFIFGAGNGILGQVALSLGARQVILLDKNKEELLKALAILKAHGWIEGRQIGEGHFLIYKVDFENSREMAELSEKFGLQSKNQGVIVINAIGPWDGTHQQIGIEGLAGPVVSRPEPNIYGCANSEVNRLFASTNWNLAFVGGYHWLWHRDDFARCMAMFSGYDVYYASEPIQRTFLVVAPANAVVKPTHASSPASAKGRVEAMASLSAEASTSEGRRAASPAACGETEAKAGLFDGAADFLQKDLGHVNGLLRVFFSDVDFLFVIGIQASLTHQGKDSGSVHSGPVVFLAESVKKNIHAFMTGGVFVAGEKKGFGRIINRVVGAGDYIPIFGVLKENFGDPDFVARQPQPQLYILPLAFLFVHTTIPSSFTCSNSGDHSLKNFSSTTIGDMSTIYLAIGLWVRLATAWFTRLPFLPMTTKTSKSEYRLASPRALEPNKIILRIRRGNSLSSNFSKSSKASFSFSVRPFIFIAIIPFDASIMDYNMRFFVSQGNSEAASSPADGEEATRQIIAMIEKAMKTLDCGDLTNALLAVELLQKPEGSVPVTPELVASLIAAVQFVDFDKKASLKILNARETFVSALIKIGSDSREVEQTLAKLLTYDSIEYVRSAAARALAYGLRIPFSPATVEALRKGSSDAYSYITLPCRNALERHAKSSSPAAFSSLAPKFQSSSAVRSGAQQLSSLAAKEASSPAQDEKQTPAHQKLFRHLKQHRAAVHLALFAFSTVVLNGEAYFVYPFVCAVASVLAGKIVADNFSKQVKAIDFVLGRVDGTTREDFLDDAAQNWIEITFRDGRRFFLSFAEEMYSMWWAPEDIKKLAESVRIPSRNGLEVFLKEVMKRDFVWKDITEKSVYEAFLRKKGYKVTRRRPWQTFYQKKGKRYQKAIEIYEHIKDDPQVVEKAWGKIKYHIVVLGEEYEWGASWAIVSEWNKLAKKLLSGKLLGFAISKDYKRLKEKWELRDEAEKKERRRIKDPWEAFFSGQPSSPAVRLRRDVEVSRPAANGETVAARQIKQSAQAIVARFEEFLAQLEV